MSRIQELMDSNDPIFNSSRTIPLPPLPPNDTSTPSPVYQLIKRQNNYPPILRINSWTRSAPYKEQCEHRSPVESIANNYTPPSSNLKIRTITSSAHITPNTQTVRPGCLLPTALPGFHEKQMSISAKSAAKSLIKRKRTGNGAYRKEAKQRESHSSSPEDDEGYSRPMSPSEQYSLMYCLEGKNNSITEEPLPEETERYYRYIHVGIPLSAIYPMPADTLVRVENDRLPVKISKDTELLDMIQKLRDEISEDYEFTLKKIIVDYILLDPCEMSRLGIKYVPKPFPQRVIRAPVPWHNQLTQSKSKIDTHLFLTNPVVTRIQNLWDNKYCDTKFVYADKLYETDFPVSPTVFIKLCRDQCAKTRAVLLDKWLSECADVLLTERNSWEHLIPSSASSNDTALVQQFFTSISALMNAHIRELVERSLREIADFFNEFSESNSFEGDYYDFNLKRKPILLIELLVQGSDVIFAPNKSEVTEILMEVVDEIVNSAMNIPRVETLIFPQLKSYTLLLHFVQLDDELVLHTKSDMNSVLSVNWMGLESYLGVYSQYEALLNGEATKQIEEFLQEDEVVLKSFRQHFDVYNRIIDQLYVLWVDVRLGLFSLSCTDLNQLLISNARSLLNQLSLFLAQYNRTINKNICDRYEEIAKKLEEDPEDTEAMTDLRKFVEEAQSITITGLLEEVKDSLARLSFIIELCDMTDEDIKINSFAFLWPKRIDPLFDEARLKLLTSQEKAIAKVNEMKEDLEKLLTGLDQEIEDFKEKEISRDMDEVYADKKLLDDITKRILECQKEAQNVNNEEELLGL
ncbi:Dynein heavy chain 3, axonemal-like [Oopsacas minuta]|uniref:Dynein heavy chain 3, axonemal-like n=1 Tax=Oopsacas minuta TaxID=111878 RepID=A0AAV7JZ18_9METZ|nr:Dynein heavy chain 3, axonemal-like [Oopsacas minuta]